MSIEDVECEHDGVLGRIQVGDNVDVHGTDHHCDANQDQQETELHVDMYRRMGEHSIIILLRQEARGSHYNMVSATVIKIEVRP